MRKLVKRLRQLEAAHQEQGNIGLTAMQEVMGALPQLLDRLEKLEELNSKFQEESLHYMSQNAKLEAVVEAAKHQHWSQNSRELNNALAALEGEKE